MEETNWIHINISFYHKYVLHNSIKVDMISSVNSSGWFRSKEQFSWDYYANCLQWRCALNILYFIPLRVLLSILNLNRGIRIYTMGNILFWWPWRQDGLKWDAQMPNPLIVCSNPRLNLIMNHGLSTPCSCSWVWRKWSTSLTLISLLSSWNDILWYNWNIVESDVKSNSPCILTFCYCICQFNLISAPRLYIQG